MGPISDGYKKVCFVWTINILNMHIFLCVFMVKLKNYVVPCECIVRNDQIDKYIYLIHSRAKFILLATVVIWGQVIALIAGYIVHVKVACGDKWLYHNLSLEFICQ